MKTPMTPRARGFSLIEVLIAVVIMSVGLLALAALQIGIVRASSEAKTQTMAINLARDKLEDLVTYKLLEEPTNTCNAANDSYQCITGSGSAESIAQGGVSFSRTWVVNRCTLDGAATTFTCSNANITAANATGNPRNEFKVVDVFVSWGDAAGQTQTVSVKDSVSAYSPADVALIQNKSYKLTPRFARERIYDPASEAGVIPIAVGGGTESAATNPKPEVVTQTGAVVETRFNVLTYSGLNGGAADAQSRVETAMVGCTCDFSARPSDQNASTNSTRAKRPTYWNGYRYVAPDDATYVPTSGPASGVNQSDRCTICCRDHFDPSTLAAGLPKFSPYLAQHKHYNSAVAGSPEVVYPNQYREACRIIRVDGIFRVAADLNNDYFNLLATKDLSSASYYNSSSVPDATATTNYQDFVVDYLDTRYTNQNTIANYNDPTSVNTGTKETTHNLNLPASVTIGTAYNGRLVNTAISGITKATPAVVTHSTTYTDLNGNALAATNAFQNGDVVSFYDVGGMTLLNGRTFIVGNVTATTFALKELVNGVVTDFSTAGTTYKAYTGGGTASVNHSKWLHARGLYVDYLEQDALDAIAVAKVDSACTASTAAMSTCILKLLPFTSINLTEIAGFASADSNQIAVTNNNYSDSITKNDPVRGQVTFVPGATDGTAVNATSTSRKGNSSLLDLGVDSADAISPADASLWTDNQAFQISNAVPLTKPGGGHFYVETTLAARTGYGPNYKTGSQASSSCGATTGPSSGYLSKYDCNVTNQESTLIAPVDLENAGLTTPGSVSVQLVGYNYKVSTGSVSSGNVTCTDANGLNPLTFGLSNGDPMAQDTCANLSVSSVTQVPNRGTIGTPTYTGTDGAANEKANITFTDLQANDVVKVTFGSPVNFTPTTCTYTCSKTNCSDNGNKYNAKAVCP